MPPAMASGLSTGGGLPIQGGFPGITSVRMCFYMGEAASSSASRLNHRVRRRGPDDLDGDAMVGRGDLLAVLVSRG